jgi:hypothetical protein
MTWWRRNWVDVLMVALVATVIVGFLALIFRDRLPRLFGGGTTTVVTTTPVATAEPMSEPSTADAEPEAAPAEEEGSANEDAAVATTPASTEESDGAPAVDAAPVEEPAANEDAALSDDAPVVEAAPADKTEAEAPAAEAVTESEPTAEETTSGDDQATSAAEAEDTATAAPSTGPATRAEYRASYRIAIATFKDQARAERLATKAREAGESRTWAVNTGESSVVLVGPYASLEEAQAAHERVKRTYPDAILYRPNKTEATPASTGAEASAQATTSQASVTLQLGAFKDPRSADKLIALLDGTGYHVTVRSSPDGFTRVLLGPITAEERVKAEAALKERGITAFASR